MNLVEEKQVKKKEKRKRQKQKEKKKKDEIQAKEFLEKAEQKKIALRKIKEKELVETKSALNKFAKQFTVDGEPDFDPKSFFNITRKCLLRILKKNFLQKKNFSID